MDVVAYNQNQVEPISTTVNDSPMNELFKQPYNQHLMDPFMFQYRTHENYDDYVKEIMPIATDVLEGLILKGQIDVFTTAILPWRDATGLNYTMNKYQIDTPLAPDVPYEGVVRWVSVRRQKKSGGLTRKGLGFYMQTESLTTDEGRRMLYIYLLQLSQSVIETSAYYTVFALLNCNTFEKKLEMQFGKLRVSLAQIIDNECSWYACLAKNDKGWDWMIEQGKATLNRNGIEPDTLIVSPDILVYLGMVDANKATFKEGGPQAIEQYKSNPFFITSHRGLDIVKSRFWTTDPQAREKTDPLVRPEMSGEYTMMCWDKRGNRLTHYESNLRDIGMYDEPRDDWFKVQFAEALENTQMWSAKDKTWDSRVFEWFNDYNEDSDKQVDPKTLLRNYQDKNRLQEGGALRRLKEQFVNKTLPLSIATINRRKDGELYWAAAKYFGQMLSEFITIEDFVQVAESITLKLGSEFKFNFADFEDFKSVVKGMQTSRYSEFFTQELIKTNLDNNLDSSGQFVGEMTPQLPADSKWGQNEVIREWKPFSTGTLRLPQIELNEHPEIAYPYTHHSGAGLVEIWSHMMNNKSCWYKLAKKINPAMRALSHIVALLKKSIPNSLCLDPDSRAPWFHNIDDLANFIDNCLPLNAPPLFLSTARNITDSGSNEKIMNQSDKVIYYSPFEYTFTKNSDTLYNDIADYLSKNNNRYEAVQTNASFNGYRLYINPVSSEAIFLRNIPEKYALPRYLSLYFYMNDLSAAYYNTILTEITNAAEPVVEQKIAMLTSFADVMIRLLTQNKLAAQKIFVHLASKVTDVDALKASIKDVTERASAALKSNKVSAFLKDKTWVGYDNDDSAPFNGNMTNEDANNRMKENVNNNASKISAEKSANYDEVPKYLHQLYKIFFQLRQKPFSTAYGGADPFFVFDAENVKALEVNSIVNEANYNFTDTTTEQQFNELRVKWMELVNKLAKVLGNKDNDNNNNNSKSFTPEMKYVYEFFRAPIVCSLECARSLQTVSLPLVKIADPQTNYTQPISSVELVDNKLPGDVWKRSSFLTIDQLQNIKDTKINIASLPYLSKLLNNSSMDSESSRSSYSNGNGNRRNRSDDDYDFSTSDIFRSNKRRQQSYESDYDDNDSGNKYRKGMKVGAFNQQDVLSGKQFGKKKADITMSDMKKFRNTNAFGSRKDVQNSLIYEEIMNDIMKFRFDQASEIGDTLTRMLIYCILVSPCDDIEFLLKMHRGQVHVPFNVGIFRPFMQHDFVSTIIMK
jgi:hypothetical protein